LRFESNDTDGNPLNVNLTGTAFTTSARIFVLPAEHDFGEVNIDTSISQTFSLTNGGTSELIVSSMALDGPNAIEFEISSISGPFNLLLQDSLKVVIEFKPRFLGNKSATLRFESNDSQNPSFSVPLSGIGKDPLVSVDESIQLPKELRLKPNYPNPFNAETTILFDLPSAQRVRLIIYNILGQPVRVLLDAVEAPGFKKVQWNGRDDNGRLVGSGIYYIKLEAGNRQLIRRLTLIQ
jgi:hypothetical protein